MRLKGFLVFLLIIFCDCVAYSQRQGELTQSRILILLDESSSMIQTWPSGKPKYKAADELILRLMDSIYAVNNQVEFSLRVFGHQHTVAENNCYDTKNEVAFSKDNRTQMAFRLEDIKPLGVTPIAYSLEQAAEHDLLDEQHNAYSIILLTDGGESCGGDLCDVMKKLLRSKVYFKPYIVSLENDATLKTTYSCMGDYLQVTKDDDIPRAVNTIVEAFRPIIKITPQEYKQMQILVANTPSILKVNIPTTRPVEPPADTSKAIKTFKETTPEPAPVVQHTIKVDEPKPKPPVEKIAWLSPARMNQLNATPPRAVALNVITTEVKLPPVVFEIPPPPPAPIVRPAPEKISRVSTAALKQRNIDIPVAANIDAVAPSFKLPEIIAEVAPPPVVKHTAEKISRAPLADRKNFNIYSEYSMPHLTLKTYDPVKLPPIVFDTPKPALLPVVEKKLPQPEKIARSIAERPKKLTTDIFTAAAPNTRKVPALPAVVYEAPAPVPAPAPPVIEVPKRIVEKIAHIKPEALKTTMTIIVFEERHMLTRRPPATPPVKFDEPKLPVVKGAKTPPNTLPVGKKLNYNIQTEEAKESIVEVYITNGKGKFYTTMPQVYLLNPATNKVEKQFYRTVDPNGNPDPQKNIPVGTYNLTFPEKKNLVISNVQVLPNQKTKITVVVADVSLYFYYLTNPGRPVKEYTATVIQRDRAVGRVQAQPGTQELQYEPGNYHIRINTFPETVRNVDLDLDDETGIWIAEPGFAKFTADSKQVVTLWKQDGNRFAPFHQLDLNDPTSQHLPIQPGEYQVHYRKGPASSPASEKMVSFIIKSNETTEVILK